MTPLLEVEGIHTAYGSSRGAVRHLARHQAGRVRVPARAQRRRQDHHHALDHGADAAVAGRTSASRARTSPAAAPYRLARRGIGYVPEDRRIFAELTVWENLDVAAALRQPARARGRMESVCELFPKLGELRDRMGGVLSGGEQQMLTIARTLMGNPELLLLDEPSEGLAPVIVENLLEQVQRLKRRGPDDPARRAGRRLLAFPGRPGVCSGERRGALFGAGRPARDDAALRNKLLAL